ncbi:MAG: aminoglycoside 6-adenylyltransferase [Vallitaleaceae bacterium]|nr:aminoglycoside 6-adenylyltransferase [Vallitaleaceae bacterium]
MLKNKKDHFVPEYESHKHAAVKNHGGVGEYDPLHELSPSELGREKIVEIKKWAKLQKSIIGALLIGSYARHEERDDSDIDFIFIVEDVELFVNDQRWIKEFGTVISSQIEYYKEIVALRVYYHEDYEIEYGLTTKNWLEKPYKEATQQVLDGPYEVIKKLEQIEL